MVKVSRNGNVYKVINRTRRHQGRTLAGRTGYQKFVKDRPAKKDKTGVFNYGNWVRMTRKEKLAVWREEGPQIIVGVEVMVKYRKNEHCKDETDLPFWIDRLDVRTPRGILTLGWQGASTWCDPLEEQEDGLITAKLEMETGYGLIKDFTFDEYTLAELKGLGYPLKSITPEKLASIIKEVTEIGGVIVKGYEIEEVELKRVSFRYRYKEEIEVSREVVSKANKRPWIWGLESDSNTAWRVANGD